MNRDYIIVEGENYLDVMKAGLSKLKLEKDQVEIKVLKEKKPSLFKKGYVQLKLTAIQELKDLQLIEEVSNLNIQAEEATLNKSVAFEGKETIKIDPPQENKTVDQEVIVEISKDKLECYITITQGDQGKLITFDDVIQKLTENNIIYGIDNEKIKNAVEKSVYDRKILIANGRKAMDGKDGEIVYHFDMKKEHTPKLLEDGTVNFKQLNLITNVVKGDLLIEIILPIEGSDGINVLGKEIPHKKGKSPKIVKGKNISESEDGLKLFAAIDGQVFFRDGKIQVSEVYEIAGDVDNSTGNIEFNGKVVVRGNIKSGFRVNATGDIEVNGVVEGATLIAKENIILNRGVQGNNQAYLECGGNLISKYIENANLKVAGNIETDCIMHSIVIAKGNIIANGKRGLIVGGQVRALNEVVAKTIGSHMGTSTTIEVGIDPDERQRYNELKEEKNEVEKNINNLTKTITLLNKLRKNTKLSKEKEEIFIKSLKTHEYLKDKYQKIAKEIEDYKFKMQDLSEGKVHVSNKIHPRVKIEISNAVKHVYDTIPICTLYKKEGEIVIGPYEK